MESPGYADLQGRFRHGGRIRTGVAAEEVERLAAAYDLLFAAQVPTAQRGADGAAAEGPGLSKRAYGDLRRDVTTMNPPVRKLEGSGKGCESSSSFLGWRAASAS